MKIRSAISFAVTISCALAACKSPPAAPKRAEPVRLIKAPSDLTDLGVAGFVLHPPLTTDAPGLIEFVDANRATIGKMTSSTVRTETSVSTTMTIEGIGNAEPLTLIDETVGDGTLTRVTVRHNAEATTYEHDPAGTFLVVANGKIPVDDEHEAELSAAMAHVSFDPRFRIFIALSQDRRVAEVPEMKEIFIHKTDLCSSVLNGLIGLCLGTCGATKLPVPVPLAVCAVVCGVALADVLACWAAVELSVNDAWCDQYAPPGFIGRANATEHDCIQLCDQSRCDASCKNTPGKTGGSCPGSQVCRCTPTGDEGDDASGDGTSGDDTSADDTSADDTSGDTGGSCTGWQTWCDCIGENNEYHGLVCSETPERLIDDCWNSCD